ncbi:hypothetical protein AZI86_04685 [Bdellovibrio bacteriovorus]|uniref:Polyamine aminopropyltransferase n=2 Tax=Bdellovibrio bacteriovorus TaxID=959 RepID=A0A150WQ78_BDEBC|nr:hypothetical protein AZI86_04685 [Bdellovibrio bacteriovorus]
MNVWLSCTLIFALSFCSLAYELFLAKILTDLSQNEILSQSLGIGLFLLGLGAGAALSSVWKTDQPVKRLFYVECLLVSLAFLVIPSSYGIAFLHHLSPFGPAGFIYYFVGLLIFAVGLLSGFEFPLLWQEQGEKMRASIPLAMSYLGGLFAGFAVPLILNPGWGPFKAIIFLGLINAVIAFSLLPFVEKNAWLKPRYLSWLLLPTAALYMSSLYSPQLEQAYLKASYFKVQIPDLNVAAIKNIWNGLKLIPTVQRWYSPYQKIDLVQSSAASSWAMDPLEGVTLYLDRRLQFNESSYQIYHESMVYGAFNLRKKVPENILILGGGDGLLATELLKHPEIKRIDLVEIDPKMIELGKENFHFTRLNQGSLENPRVNVHIEDGFAFMKHQAPEQFDAVFIDFPYPHSPDLLRLYSVEFYKIVRRTLTPKGFVIMDGPLYSPDEMQAANTKTPPQWVLRDTIKSAGFKNIFAFGNFEGFYFFTKDEFKAQFDYGRIPQAISNPALVNLQNLNGYLEGGEDTSRVNSLFRPYPIMPGR